MAALGACAKPIARAIAKLNARRVRLVAGGVGCFLAAKIVSQNRALFCNSLEVVALIQPELPGVYRVRSH